MLEELNYAARIVGVKQLRRALADGRVRKVFLADDADPALTDPIREDMLDKIVRDLPTMVSFRTHVENGSMFNTPPVFPIYVLKETLKWLKSIGGVPEIYRRNQAKAALLYDEIDRNPLFRGTVDKEDRSLMNICFVMADGYEELAPEFMEFAKSKGMVGIKGHRSVGGFRASIYNACPQESVDALVACMQEFEKNHKK